jgi:hypothetical protein
MTETEMMREEQSFRLRVVESLAKLETLAQSTEDHLKRLNGTVARHEVEINVLKEDVLTEKVKSRTSLAWWRRISPLIWLGIGGLLVLFLVHSDDLLRAFSKP